MITPLIVALALCGQVAMVDGRPTRFGGFNAAQPVPGPAGKGEAPHHHQPYLAPVVPNTASTPGCLAHSVARTQKPGTFTTRRRRWTDQRTGMTCGKLSYGTTATG
jgi:hypothetical protein